MANVPSWFNGSVYMQNKLASLKATDSTMTYDKMLAAFTEAGFIGEEGYYQHFEQYGSKAAENLSPNAFFDPYEYAQFKAISYFTSDEAGDKKVDEATVRGDIKYYAGQITQAFSDAGMSAWEHYNQYGAAEKINTSNAFDESDYLAAKAAALNKAEGVDTWTADTVRTAIINAGMTPLTHYMEYAGKSDNEVKAGSTFAVPENEQVKEGSSSDDDSTGSTFTFTDKVGEALEGTAGDDTFNGVLSYAAGVYTAAESTFNLGDTADGKAGTDTFNLTLAGATGTAYNAPAGASTSNIEKINIVHTNNAAVNGGDIFNSATWDGVKELWQTDNDSTAATTGTFQAVTTGQGVAVGYASNGVAGATAGTSAAAVAAAGITVGATQTSLDILLDGVGTASTVGLVADGAKLTTVNVSGSVANADANGTAGVLTVVNGTAANAVTTDTFALTSKTDVRFTSGAWNNKVATVDFSDSTGAITSNLLDASFQALATVNGGSAGDTLRVNTFLAGKDISIDAGAGNDTVTISATAAATTSTNTATIKLGEGKDTLAVAATYSNLGAATTADDLAKSMTKISDFDKSSDTLDLNNATGTWTTFTATQLTTIAGKDDLLAAATEAATLAGTNKVSVFNYGNNMYVLVNDNTAGIATGDGLIELTGVQTTDLVEGLNGNFVHA